MPVPSSPEIMNTQTTSLIITWAFRGFFTIALAVSAFLFRWIFLRAVRKVDEFGEWRQGITEKGDVVTKAELKKYAGDEGMVTRDQFFSWSKELCAKCLAMADCIKLCSWRDELQKGGGAMVEKDHTVFCEHVVDRMFTRVHELLDHQNEVQFQKLELLRQSCETNATAIKDVADRQMTMLETLNRHLGEQQGFK